MEREQILRVVREFFAQNNLDFSEEGLDVPIFDSGLDSLDFAVLVAKLELEFGVDPFSESESAIYPETLRAFVDCYARDLP
jgi:acyl carrier protein